LRPKLNLFVHCAAARWTGQTLHEAMHRTVMNRGLRGHSPMAAQKLHKFLKKQIFGIHWREICMHMPQIFAVYNNSNIKVILTILVSN
jgi:hypothetical protein